MVSYHVAPRLMPKLFFLLKYRDTRASGASPVMKMENGGTAPPSPPSPASFVDMVRGAE